MIPPLTKESRLSYGKAHRGSQLKDVPASYLLWLYDNCELSVQLKRYIEDNKQSLEAEKRRNNKNLYR
jgi:hypothetical protein